MKIELRLREGSPDFSRRHRIAMTTNPPKLPAELIRIIEGWAASLRDGPMGGTCAFNAQSAEPGQQRVAGISLLAASAGIGQIVRDGDVVTYDCRDWKST